MQFSKTILPNGTRVIFVPMPESPTVTVLVFAEVGSKYEDKKMNGISHFLEHSLFKGTTSRPKSSDISRELDALGAQYNAFTGQEYTGYYAKAHKDKAEKIFDVIADMYLHPVFDYAELEKEKGVIIQEINMYEDDPMRNIQDVFMDVLYGDQPAGWSIAGTRESVTGIQAKDIRAYHTAHYVSGATTVILSGAFSEKVFFEKIDTIFGSISSTEKPSKQKVVEAQTTPVIFLKKKDTDQVHLVLGVRAFGVFDPRGPILRVLASVLSGGMSSRLFQKMRDELGLCYYVSATPDLYTDHGVFQVSAGVDPEKVISAVSAIMNELSNLATTLVPHAELRKAKDVLIGNLYLGLESSDELAQFYGGQEVLGRPIRTPEAVSHEVETVTAQDIQTLAKELFVSKNLNLALIGKFEDKKSLAQVLTF